MGLSEVGADRGLVDAHHGGGLTGGALESVPKEYGVTLPLGEPGDGGVETDGVGQHLVPVGVDLFRAASKALMSIGSGRCSQGWRHRCRWIRQCLRTVQA